MGELATEEYYFKEVVSYSSVKSFIKIKLPFTESSYLVGYDGTIKAGIDFSKIRVNKNDDTSVITISLPKAKILSTEIDTESFELYSEKEGLGNHISVTEYNNSLSELKKTARANAEKRGLLDQADENAKNVISTFIRSLPLNAAYNVQFVTVR